MLIRIKLAHYAVILLRPEPFLRVTERESDLKWLGLYVFCRQTDFPQPACVHQRRSNFFLFCCYALSWAPVSRGDVIDENDIVVRAPGAICRQVPWDLESEPVRKTVETCYMITWTETCACKHWKRACYMMSLHLEGRVGGQACTPRHKCENKLLSKYGNLYKLRH